MKRLVIVLSLLPWSTSGNAGGPECLSPLGPAVPDAATAQRIGEAVIAARQSADVGKKYQLRVAPDEKREGGWIVSQSLRQPRNGDPKAITVIVGGGGITMRIDRCTGEISGIHYQR